MLGNVGADGVEPVETIEASDGRTKALPLMSKALAHLDNDERIPANIGAQLQTAIDALWISGSAGPSSVHLH